MHFVLRPTLRWTQRNVIWLEKTSLDAAYCTDYHGGRLCSSISIITFQRWFCWFQSYHSSEGTGIVGGLVEGEEGGGRITNGGLMARFFRLHDILSLSQAGRRLLQATN